MTFRMYQMNLDGEQARVYKGYWEQAAVRFIEDQVLTEQAYTREPKTGYRQNIAVLVWRTRADADGKKSIVGQKGRDCKRMFYPKPPRGGFYAFCLQGESGE